MKIAISTFTLTRMLLPTVFTHRERALQEEPTKPQASTSAPQCAAIGANELTITCAYTTSSSGGADSRTSPRIMLDPAVISFVPPNESHMSVDLTFANNSVSKIADQHTVYLAIDDERGENHIRRSLPYEDFTEFEPGKHTKLQEALLAPAFSPGPYVVSIYIPLTGPSLKFDRARNSLLSSNEVRDLATGLN